jgi:hypothetical protein
VGKTGEERERNLEILKLMSKKIEIIDKKKAANKLITEEHEVSHQQNLSGDKKKKKETKKVSRKARAQPAKLKKQKKRKK